MKILAVHPDPLEQGRLAAALRELGHEVRQAQSDTEARDQLSTRPDVLVVSAGLKAAAGLIRDIRRPGGRPYLYVLMLATATEQAELLAAYEAGCDSDARAPASPADLRARLLAAERTITRVGALAKLLAAERTSSLVGAPTAANGAVCPAAPAEAAGPATPAEAKTSPVSPMVHAAPRGPPTPTASPHPARGGPEPASRAALPPAQDPVALVASSTPWRTIGEKLRATAHGFLNQEVSVEAREQVVVKPEVAAGIRLINVQHELEMFLAMAVSSETAGKLCSHLFGKQAPELAADMLGELINVCMGVLKNSFNEQSLAFSSALPQTMDAEHFQLVGADAPLHEAFSLAVAGGAIHVHLAVCIRKNEPVTVADLREGMIVANDVIDDHGMLLLKAGALLSSWAAERLREGLADDQTLTVAMANG